MTIYYIPSLPPCRVNSWNCIRTEFLDIKLLVFTLPKASRANTTKLINAKAKILVNLVILIHGLSLALHVQNNIALLFYWFWLNTWNAQDVRATRFESLGRNCSPRPVLTDLFSLYILFSQCRSCDVPKGICFLSFHKSCVHNACTRIRRNFKETPLQGNITWPTLGKQNKQAKEVYTRVSQLQNRIIPGLKHFQQCSIPRTILGGEGGGGQC